MVGSLIDDSNINKLSSAKSNLRIAQLLLRYGSVQYINKRFLVGFTVFLFKVVKKIGSTGLKNKSEILVKKWF